MPQLPLAILAEVFPGLLDLPGQLAQRSLDGYRYDLQQYLAWCGFEPRRALDPQSLRAWRQYMVAQTSLTPHTINRRLDAVKRIVRATAVAEAMDQGVAYRFSLVERVPLSTLRQRLRRRQALTKEQVRALLRAPDPTTLGGLRDRALLSLLAGSGCRLGEALSVQVGDWLAVPGGWLVQLLGKGQTHYRQAPLSREAVVWLERWLRVRTEAGVEVLAVFTGLSNHYERPTTRRLTVTPAWRRVKRYGRQIGVPWLSPHDLRRFVGTQVAAVHGLRAAQKALGHKRLETTVQHYVLDVLQPGLTDGLY